MLAYIFWHCRYPHIDKTSYQKLIIDFHQTLRSQKPGGFQYSTVFQIENAPWIGKDREGYEEWYVVDNSAALDVLNEAAVTGPCKEPHNRVASQAAAGAGGLYRLHAGEPGLATAQVALWFAKPSGMGYENLYATLQPEINKVSGSLWRRQMVLGPAPEFRWHSPQDHALPAALDCLRMPLTRIWTGL
jgi:hypothetical protein